MTIEATSTSGWREEEFQEGKKERREEISLLSTVMEFINILNGRPRVPSFAFSEFKLRKKGKGKERK